jgi:hypothetical protein
LETKFSLDQSGAEVVGQRCRCLLKPELQNAGWRQKILRLVWSLSNVEEKKEERKPNGLPGEVGVVEKLSKSRDFSLSCVWRARFLLDPAAFRT